MENIAAYIDHTLLKPDATKEQIDVIVEEAAAHKFASVCVNPYWVSYCADKLQGTDVKVCTVIGFPLGASTSAVKALETKDAIEKGAGEIDMVINIGALKSGDLVTVESDIRAVTEAANGVLTKVIIETALLTEEEKVTACELAVKAGADYVKTSTGFSGGGATVADIALMRKTVGPDIGVKASGGVRDREATLAMIETGATRIGASAGVQIIAGGAGTSDY
ncbi:deoxyribose-phosphate aldolase [Terribacillus sp. DMT04]|uniref:deoxyribose-phosphate aldolase n=1 Tax=Terribacillus sp. DMT04 TaxID=2850441 RepID=UPI001C2BE273|nr:deoxyribose-phosphate aldolase [Terribacillus sp. DMT04]QXE00471.1 deoxyribose-phosphate aldolase [Terribacillus sp. DMT04]